MPYVLQLLPALKQAGWKVKMLDSERLEPPHITIYQKMRKWRLSLRDRTFLDKGDEWNQIDEGVRQAVVNGWGNLIAAWNTIHPENPVNGDSDE